MTERPLTRATRLLLLVYSGLGLAAGVPLFLGTENTDEYFAWTIKPPLTAAFLGAAYWATFLFYVFSSRERTWARARLTLPVGFAFTTLMLVATLIHLDRFHLHASGRVAQGVAWSWLVVYVAVPPLTLGFLIRQWRLPGVDSLRKESMPSWMRVSLGLQSAVMVGLGVALLAAPQTADAVWPWALSPLTGRATGAWLVGIGAAAAYTVVENELDRVRWAFVSFGALAVLEAVAVARFSGTPDWGGVRIWVYLLFLLTLLVVALAGLLRVSKATAPVAR